MEKEKGLHILQEVHVIHGEGWVKLSPLLLKTLGIQEGDMLVFLADEQGFRVKGEKTPPRFHASTEKPPRTQTLQSTPVPNAELTQMNLFETGTSHHAKRTRRK